MIVQLSGEDLLVISEWLLVCNPELTVEKNLRRVLVRAIGKSAQRVLDFRKATPHRE